MIAYGHGTIGFVLTSISLVFILFAFVVSLIIIINIIFHQYYHRLEREEKIILVRSSHIYSFLFISAMLLASMNIQTLLGDIHGNDFYSNWCIFRGYCSLVCGTTMYFTFVIQVNFDRCRTRDLQKKISFP